MKVHRRSPKTFCLYFPTGLRFFWGYSSSRRTESVLCLEIIIYYYLFLGVQCILGDDQYGWGSSKREPMKSEIYVRTSLTLKLKASYYRFSKVPEGFYAQQRDYDVQEKGTFEWAHWVWNVTNSTDRAYCSLVHSLIILEPNFLKSYFYYLFCERVWNMEPKPGGGKPSAAGWGELPGGVPVIF